MVQNHPRDLYWQYAGGTSLLTKHIFSNLDTCTEDI